MLNNAILMHLNKKFAMRIFYTNARILISGMAFVRKIIENEKITLENSIQFFCDTEENPNSTNYEAMISVREYLTEYQYQIELVLNKYKDISKTKKALKYSKELIKLIKEIRVARWRKGDSIV